MHRIITKIESKEGMIIQATFANGRIVEVDIEKLFGRTPSFVALKDKDLFNHVRIDGIGYGISWNDDLDLSSDFIYNNGKTIGFASPNIKLAFAEALTYAREQEGISQRELAKRTKIIQADISKMEQGKGNPTLSTLDRLAKALNCSISSLVGI